MVGTDTDQKEDDNSLLSSEKPPEAERYGEQAFLARDTTASHPVQGRGRVPEAA